MNVVFLTVDVTTNHTDGRVTIHSEAVIEATELRTNPIYSIYFNWFRFIAVGIVPFGLLVFFNAKIYFALRLRRQRAGFRRAQAGGISTRA